MFKLGGYNYALSSAGIEIGYGLLGKVFREFVGRPTAEVRERSAEYFRPHLNIMRVIGGYTGAQPKGTIEDRRARLCYTSSGKFFGLIVCIRADNRYFSVMLPFFNEPDGAVAYFNFLNNDQERLRVQTCQIDPDRFLVSQESRDVFWPKNGVEFNLD